ncbi:MAG: MFS transporter [Candidatus Dormibacteraeota bacterium]|nr:MFS transporter [Candidatus Dormibacteraeota bacterium]MBV8445835.1 MFS transporter [Candidatus Dormibacteraeota bacterium]
MSGPGSGIRRARSITPADPLPSGAGGVPTAEPGRRLPTRFVPPALRVRHFRWYWAAQWPTLLGTWMQVVALGYLVYSRTGSTTAVAVVAAADGLPAVVLSLAGGVLADRLPRRRILLVTQSLLGLTAGSLAVLVATGHASFGAIVAVALAFGATDAVDLPTRQALVADLVERDLVVNAVALGSAAMSATRIVGPSVAGLLIGIAGPAVCFGALSLAYLVPIVVLLLVIPDIPPLSRDDSGSAVHDLLAGFREALRDPLVRGVLLACAALAFFGVSYMPFLPVLAKTQLHAGAQVLGLMYSVGGIGGLVAGVLVAGFGRSARRRSLLLVGGPVYAVSLFCVAHSSALLLTLLGLVGISFAFLAINTSLNTIIQTETNAVMRGRMLGIYATLFAGLQPLGTVAYGLLPAPQLFTAIGFGAIAVGVVTVAVAARRSFRLRTA